MFPKGISVMTKIDILLEVLLLISGIVLTVSVLLQKSKSQGLSGTIADRTETFYGRNNGGKKEKVLTIITIVSSVVFIALALAVYFKQADYQTSQRFQDAWHNLIG